MTTNNQNYFTLAWNLYRQSGRKKIFTFGKLHHIHSFIKI